MSNDLEEIKSEFRAKGWSYAKAAVVLDRHPQYIYEVLNGRRVSRALLRRIKSLSVAPRTRHDWRARQ